MLLLDKALHVSSNHALQAVKRLYRAEKAGHAGTLDPLATGLLPILLGDATRFSGYLLDARKRYEAEVRLGATTTTGDAEGEVLERRTPSAGRDEILGVLKRFVGVQAQVPPMYSALKREGTPLYVLARRGEIVERAPRTIEIYALEPLAVEQDRLVLDVSCSKGTYIRTLAEDIGEALGCGAHLSGLRRTGAGAFRIGQASTLEALAALGEAERDALLKPADELLEQLSRVDLQGAEESRFRHGQVIEAPSGEAGVCRVYGEGGRFLGLAERGGNGRLAPKRLLAEAPVAPPPTS